jgi:hypothetical protein
MIKQQKNGFEFHRIHLYKVTFQGISFSNREIPNLEQILNSFFLIREDRFC